MTEDFATYPLQGAVEEDIRTAYRLSGGNVDDLPRLPKSQSPASPSQVPAHAPGAAVALCVITLLQLRAVGVEQHVCKAERDADGV